MKRIIPIARWVIAIGVGLLIFRWGRAHMEGTSGWDPGAAFGIVMALLAYGLLLVLLFAYPMVMRTAERIASLYWPDDANFRVVPQYSIAEARVKQGRYAEAVDEYHKVIEQHPDNVYAHFRVAELYVEYLHQPKFAEPELLAAIEKAQSEETFMFAAQHLADLYQHSLHDLSRAHAALARLVERYPNTKHAQAATARMEVLSRLLAANQPP